MTRNMGIKIGESIEVLEEVDVGEDGIGWSRYLRIQVNIDLRKPLERGRTLNLEGKPIWIPFKYEKLSAFCFQCGCINHGNKGCGSSR